jgi:hypothetical protein
MNEMQDILGSMVFGGIIMVMVISFNGNISESAALQTFHTTVQTNATTVTNILEYDLRKLGYRVTSSDKITIADTNRIAFKGDFDNNGTTDSITYYVGSTVPSGVSNPRSRLLYRQLNANSPQTMNLGITKFHLWYYGANGASTDTLSQIRTIKVALSFESNSPYNGIYSGAYWERVIKPKNLR